MPRMMRCFWLLLLCPIFMNVGISRGADNVPLTIKEATTSYVAGKDYRVLAVHVPTDVKKNQIEVKEFFWYGCPHCYHLERFINAWKPSLASDVDFIRVPAFFGANIWKDHAALYYTLQSMGLLKKAHESVFDEIQNNRNYLENIDKMAAFLNKRFGVNEEKFKAAYHSINITHKLLKASSEVRSYGLRGVPVITVDGRYVVSPDMAGSLENMIAVTNYLIKKVRSDRKIMQGKN